MTTTQILHSEACERNKGIILKNLNDFISTKEKYHLLEVGFGTGQHVYHFSESLPNVTFTVADVENYHGPFLERVKAFGKRENINGPFKFQAFENEVEHNLPKQQYDGIYCANVFHIMSWQEAKETIKFMADFVSEKGNLFFYGPFKFEGKFTSPSNRDFDHHLKSREPKMGIREFEEVENLLKSLGLNLQTKRDLPANNNLLVFTKS